MSTVVLSPVRQRGYWRVKIVWPKHTARFGKFNSLVEAEEWITRHRWLTEQRQEPDDAEADDPDDGANDR